MKNSIKMLVLFSLPLQAQTETTPPHGPWSLDVPLAVPEGLGLNLQYRVDPWIAVHAFHHLPTPLRIKTVIKSRKLVDREGVVIRSPNIDLPFNVQLGPHQGIGASLHPFANPFHLMLALESRLLKIDSTVQSHLEVIDSQSRALTNTLFQASAQTSTEQTLLRTTLGYRWDIGETNYFFSLYSGWARPMAAHTRVKTEVRVRNLEASNPANIDARNLQEAEQEQSAVIYKKVMDELRKFENRSLPILGISFGFYL